MKVKFVFALFPLILPCNSHLRPDRPEALAQCLKTAKEEWKKCLDEAISQEDKTSLCRETGRTNEEVCQDGE